MKRYSSKSKERKAAPSRASKPETNASQIEHLLERISEGFVAFDSQMKHVYVNRRAGELIGRKPQDLIGKSYWDEYPEAHHTPFIQACVRALETQVPIEFEDYYEPMDNWFETRIYPSEDGLSVFFADITRRKHAEARIKHLTRLYATLSQINQTIVRVKDRQELFESICHVAIKFGQFHLAWIGLTEQETGNVKIVASDGDGQKYLEQININFEEEISREGPTAQAILQNTVVVVNDVKTDPRMEPWRAAVLQQEYRSLAAVPLCAHGEVIGVLDLYATETNFYNDDELRLLKEIGSDISFALDVLRAEKERQHAHQKLEIQLQQLSALRAIDSAITAGLDLRLFLDTFLQHIVTQPGADAAAVWKFHPAMSELEFASARGFRNPLSLRSQIGLRGNCAGKAVLERRLVHTSNLSRSRLDSAEMKQMAEEGFISCYAVPLITKGEIKGVLELYQRSPFDPGPEWLGFVQTLADQAAIAIAEAELFNNLQRSNFELLFAYDETIEGWSRALDLRDKETVGHTQRVTRTAMRLASLMGMNEAELVHVRRGALLHDIGKMGVPDAVLLKPGSLTDEEWEIMRKHPQFAYDMLSPILYLRPALDIPYCHHERWDGTGYPRGLKEEEIPLTARIFAIVDVWDALTSDRPYRPAWTPEKTLAYIQSQTGSHFDPGVVKRTLDSGILIEQSLREK